MQLQAVSVSVDNESAMNQLLKNGVDSAVASPEVDRACVKHMCQLASVKWSADKDQDMEGPEDKESIESTVEGEEEGKECSEKEGKKNPLLAVWSKWQQLLPAVMSKRFTPISQEGEYLI